MLDEDEFPMYPLGNVLITSAKFDNNKLTYNVQLTLADKAKEKGLSKDSLSIESYSCVLFKKKKLKKD